MFKRKKEIKSSFKLSIALQFIFASILFIETESIQNFQILYYIYFIKKYFVNLLTLHRKFLKEPKFLLFFWITCPKQRVIKCKFVVMLQSQMHPFIYFFRKYEIQWKNKYLLRWNVKCYKLGFELLQKYENNFISGRQHFISNDLNNRPLESLSKRNLFSELVLNFMEVTNSILVRI